MPTQRLNRETGRRFDFAPTAEAFPPLPEFVDFMVNEPLLRRHAPQEDVLAVVEEERDMFHSAATALLEEKKALEADLARTQVELNEAKAANAILQRAVEELTNVDLRLNAIMAFPEVDDVLEKLQKSGEYVLTADSSEKDRQIIQSLAVLGKVRLEGNAFITDAGRAMLQDWA